MGRAFILLITKDIERKAIIRKAKKTTPNDLKLDFRFKTCNSCKLSKTIFPI